MESFLIFGKWKKKPLKNLIQFLEKIKIVIKKNIFVTIDAILISERMGEKMENIDRQKVISILNDIMKYELAGVVRYTHSALMVVGPYRESLVTYFNEQSSESLTHAQNAGELLVSLGGHPSQEVSIIDESNEHNVSSLLSESLDHERQAVSLYKELLKEVVDKSIYLEEYAKEMIKNEEIHSLTVEKMLKDYE